MGVILKVEGYAENVSLTTPESDGRTRSRKILEYLSDEKYRADDESLEVLVEEAKRTEARVDVSKTDKWGDLRARVPDDMYPDRLVAAQGEPLHDYDVSDAGKVVSQRFRDLVEEHDPGVHQFVPVAIESHDGKPLATFYFMRILRPINAIRAEGSNLQLVAKGGSLGDLNSVHVLSRSKFSVDATLVKGFGAWREMRSRDHEFFSEELWRRMQKAGLTGFEVYVHFDEY